MPAKDPVHKRAEKAIAALRDRTGAFYATWRSGQDWRGAPIWGDRLPTIAETKRLGGVCSSALNIACHVNGITPPGEWRGGTGAWGALAEKIGEPFAGPGTQLRPGDIVGSPYKGAKLALQGHVVIVTVGGLPREARVIQWDLPLGLNERRTVAETNAMLSPPSKFSYIIRAKDWLG